MKPLSVLYVDDDENIRLIVELALTLDRQIAARTVDSAAAALAALDTGPLPDAILLDVMMPTIDGSSWLEQIRARRDTATLPVIFLTARARESDIAGYYARGVAGVIVKPFDPLTLARTVREMLMVG